MLAIVFAFACVGLRLYVIFCVNSWLYGVVSTNYAFCMFLCCCLCLGVCFRFVFSLYKALWFVYVVFLRDSICLCLRFHLFVAVIYMFLFVISVVCVYNCLFLRFYLLVSAALFVCACDTSVYHICLWLKVRILCLLIVCGNLMFVHVGMHFLACSVPYMYLRVLCL